MSLENEITKARGEIITDAYSMSIGEWISMYEDEEVDIHPEFQRFFRWSLFQKARFIESILLGIPIPPIFVAQTESGIWDVVDGLQRLSTIFEFFGILKDEDGKTLPALTLEGVKYLPSLKDKKWDDPDDPENSFTVTQRLYVKRSRIDVSIILRESEQMAKYELFQRLNTGGSPLSEQEVRNCIIVMLNKPFHKWLRDLAEDRNFQESIALTDRSILEQYDLELVLRFLIFRQMKKDKLSALKDVGEFLTEKMVDLINDKQFDYNEERCVFLKTFELISDTLGNNAFRRYVPQKGNYYGGFLLSGFEVVALGIGYHGGGLSLSNNDLESKIRSIWTDKHFQQYSGSGARANTRIPKLIPFGRGLFSS